MVSDDFLKEWCYEMKKKSDKLGYLFILPAFIIYVSVIIIPTIDSFRISMFRWNGIGEMEFIGLQNYTDLFFNDDIFWGALRNNIVWIILTLVFIVSISLLLALMLNEPYKGRTFFRGVFYFPSVLSGILVAIVWRWMFNPNFGFINEFLGLVGLENLARPWIALPEIALYAVFFSAMWQGIGQPLILFLAGLQTIPTELLEAAEVDGASKLRRFLQIKIPLLKETFIMVFATLFIAAMRVYDVIFGLTGGGPANSTQTLATYMVQQTFTFSNVGMGAAVAGVMLILMMIIIIPYVLFTTKET